MAASGYFDRYGRPYQGVFVGTFLVTLLVFPVLVAAYPASEGVPEFMIFTFLVGLILYAVPLLVVSAVIGPLVFLAATVVLDRIVPGVLTFVAGSSLSAYVSCHVGVHVDIDLFPPGLRWVPGSDWIAPRLAATAALVAAFVSTSIWAVRWANEREEAR